MSNQEEYELIQRGLIGLAILLGVAGFCGLIAACCGFGAVIAALWHA